MRSPLAAVLLLVATIAAAQDAPKPVSIAVDPLGDSEHGIVARVFFRFANPRAITEAGLFLEGTFTQAGQAPRNFRFAVPRKNDKMIWNNTVERNGEIVRHDRWAVLPDQRNEMSIEHTFAAGEAEIDVRLILEADRGGAPVTVARGSETFTLAKTNKPFVAEAVEAEPGEEAYEDPGAVVIGTPRRNAASGLFLVTAGVRPPVKRVEFWVENRKVLARNAPPYSAELDLGDSPPRVARAVGYDAAGRYVDADASVPSEGDTLAVTLTRVVTSDGLCHFKLSVRNPKHVPLKSIVLYADDRKLHEWDRPPFAVSVPKASLEGVGFIRAVVADETGHAASDRHTLP